ncbi:MAG: peptidoglycan bridge formation glycyltransferase FemA/FemB family protein [Bacilli bacterium]|nr:peptidoglycan bridge formation glycyltransferase FemA/FemB family protein [Bacilli bacterium]MBQ6840503.1 peptidoglycan bridge formation glycyltransferase FemA/FemB family protein [Bacilli bacterium]
MLKLRSISKIEFDNHIKKQNDTHFMQSTAWGEFEKVTNYVTPHYLGLVDEDNDIIAATLLLEEHLPLNCSNLYAPRGFVIDYKNKRTLRIFTNKLKDFAKSRKATSIRINPSISTEDEELNNLKDLGYKRNSNIKLLEYTYKIDLTKEQKEIEKSYSENVKSNLKDTEKYDAELIVGSQKDLEEFFQLQNNQNNDYYETIYDIFSNNEHTKVKLFLGKLHITKTIKILEKELVRVNNQIAIIPIDNLDASSKERLTTLRNQKNKINDDLKRFKEYKLEYGNSLTISATLTMEQKDKVWILSEANNQVLLDTKLNYRIYNEYIKYYKNNSFNLFNQLSPLECSPSFNEFKKEFGGEFIEYAGDYVLVTNHITNFIQNKLIPLFNKFKKEDIDETSNSN